MYFNHVFNQPFNLVLSWQCLSRLGECTFRIRSRAAVQHIVLAAYARQRNEFKLRLPLSSLFRWQTIRNGLCPDTVPTVGHALPGHRFVNRLAFNCESNELN